MEIPKYYYVRYTSEVIAGTDFFEEIDPTNPLLLNSTDPMHKPVEIKVESFETLVEALTRTTQIIVELETPHHGWVEIMIYYFDQEDTSPQQETFYTFFKYNPEIGL